ncbi:MAG TPA: YigZ family protein [Rudaea sp.]|nr:YigZ family protein [Rudaea sp.]
MSGCSTLAAPAHVVLEVRKSKFVANATAIATQEDAAVFIARVSDATATHNCWAWRLGQRYRFSDDGEPGGTAGKPILAAIDGQRMDRVAVVVTRWFGGIKLGVGGLARAYGGCAAECLRTSARVAIVDTATVECRVDYATVPRLRARFTLLDAAVEHEMPEAAGVLLRLHLPVARLDALSRLLADLTRGRGELRRID